MTVFGPPDLVILGDVVAAVDGGRVARVGGIAVAGTRIVANGRRDEMLALAGPGTRVHDAGRDAVVPGLHDFHVHLAALARARAEVSLDDAADAREVADRLRRHASRTPDGAWLLGRGWSDAQLGGEVHPLGDAVGERLAFLGSHDGHSAWASPAALRLAGIDGSAADPPGGRIQRGTDGAPTGILRETALDLVDRLVPRLRGEALRPHLEATVVELARYGITGASEAGDYTDEGGEGPDAALGDSYSALSELADVIDARLRLTMGIPVDAIDAASERSMRTGMVLPGRRTLRFGWAKEYADGALGSGTAALFEPATCGDGGTGILRVTPDGLDRLAEAARRTGISLAIHAIGDRAAAAVIDAIDRAGPRSERAAPHRLEHAQLIRPQDRERLARLNITGSVQFVHAAADRDLVDRCWRGREADAYPWRSLLDAGVRLAGGSDAPVETVDPWTGVFAAVHRRLPTDGRPDWRSSEAVTVPEALEALTRGPARSLGIADEGHLRPGAVADFAVLDQPLEALLTADDRLVSVRAVLTVVDGGVSNET